MRASTSATPAQRAHHALRPIKAGADGVSQTRPLAEITNTPRRAFSDLTNHIELKKGEAASSEGQPICKPVDHSENELVLQGKPFQASTVDSDCKDDDSIEYCFGSSEPAEWKGEIDVMDYLNSLHDSEIAKSEDEKEPLTHVPLVDIPNIPEGFFDDMPDDFLDEISEDEVCPSVFVEP